MIFGPTPLAEAQGAVLAHTHRLPGRVIKKGSVLDAAALSALHAAGLDAVVAARLEQGDVDEDEAARRIAAALPGPGLHATAAATGRVNLLAAEGGLLQVDAGQIDRLNAVDEAVTVATLPDNTPVKSGQMVATIKIIPFAVPGAVLARAEAACHPGAPMHVHPWRGLRVGLVLTTLPGLKASVIAGTVAATRTRVEAAGGTLLPPLQCPHRTGPIAEALRSLLGSGADLLLVAGASAVVDRRDVGPSGIAAAGGRILHFGMPVDPGNLICLGHIGAVPALVLPGCARSPRLNGIDLVLHRLAAGLPVTGAAVARMGVGGLLADVAARPLPRARGAGRVVVSTAGPAAVVLAAGRSSRMAPRHKLLEPDAAGRAMIAQVVDTVLASRARPVLVVTGHRAPEVQAALAGRAVQFVPAPDYADGLSASLRAGLAALPASCPAAMVVLGDMPLVTARTLDSLVAAHRPGRIVAPVHAGQIGNPVLWDRRFFPAMMALTGDSGARSVLGAHPDAVTQVPADDSVLRDFDTLESLAAVHG